MFEDNEDIVGMGYGGCRDEVKPQFRSPRQNEMKDSLMVSTSLARVKLTTTSRRHPDFEVG